MAKAGKDITPQVITIEAVADMKGQAEEELKRAQTMQEQIYAGMT